MQNIKNELCHNYNLKQVEGVKVPPRPKHPDKLAKAKMLKKSNEDAKTGSSRNGGTSKVGRTHANKDEEQKEEKPTNALTRRRSQAEVRERL